MAFYIKRKDKVNGPFTVEQIKSGVKSGKLKKADLISKSENGPWKSIGQALSVSQKTEQIPLANENVIEVQELEVVEDGGLDLQGLPEDVLSSQASPFHSPQNSHWKSTTANQRTNPKSTRQQRKDTKKSPAQKLELLKICLAAVLGIGVLLLILASGGMYLMSFKPPPLEVQARHLSEKMFEIDTQLSHFKFLQLNGQLEIYSEWPEFSERLAISKRLQDERNSLKKELDTVMSKMSTAQKDSWNLEDERWRESMADRNDAIADETNYLPAIGLIESGNLAEGSVRLKKYLGNPNGSHRQDVMNLLREIEFLQSKDEPFAALVAMSDEQFRKAEAEHRIDDGKVTNESLLSFRGKVIEANLAKARETRELNKRHEIHSAKVAIQRAREWLDRKRDNGMILEFSSSRLVSLPESSPLRWILPLKNSFKGTNAQYADIRRECFRMHEQISEVLGNDRVLQVIFDEGEAALQDAFEKEHGMPKCVLAANDKTDVISIGEQLSERVKHYTGERNAPKYPYRMASRHVFELEEKVKTEANGSQRAKDLPRIRICINRMSSINDARIRSAGDKTAVFNTSLSGHHPQIRAEALEIINLYHSGKKKTHY